MSYSWLSNFWTNWVRLPLRLLHLLPRPSQLSLRTFQLPVMLFQLSPNLGSWGPSSSLRGPPCCLGDSLEDLKSPPSFKTVSPLWGRCPMSTNLTNKKLLLKIVGQSKTAEHVTVLQFCFHIWVIQYGHQGLKRTAGAKRDTNKQILSFIKGAPFSPCFPF